MKKISMFFLLLWSFFSTTLFAGGSPQTPPYAHSFFNAHGLRGVLDPSDRWDIYGNPIYADKKESESFDSSSKNKELTITEEKESGKYEELQPLSAAELAEYTGEKLTDKLYSPEMEKIWHHDSLSWDDIAKKIYGATESDSECDSMSFSSYSDDDSTDSDDTDYSENSYLDDPYAEREPIRKRERYYYDAPSYLAYPQQEKIDDITNFLKACKIGFDDKTVSDFLKKYQNNKTFLDSIMNDTFPTPLFWAVINGNTFMVKKLLPYVIVDNPFDRSALFYAVLLKKRK